MTSQPHRTPRRLRAPRHLADIPISNIMLETSIGDVVLSALDEHNVKLRAGGETDSGATRCGAVRVNGVSVDVVAHYRRDEHGTWTRVSAGYGDDVAYRAGAHTSPTRAVLDKVETALAIAVTEWAKANPLVLAAAQHAAYQRDIAEGRTKLQGFAEQLDAQERQVADLECARDKHAARWAGALNPVPPDPGPPVSVGSVAYYGDSAHYIVWTHGADVAWGVVNGLRRLPATRVADAVRAHVREHEAAAVGHVPQWSVMRYADANRYSDTDVVLDSSEVARAAEIVGDRLGTELWRLHRSVTFQPVTVPTVAEAWSSKSRNRSALPADEQPLREALDRLADPATVRAAGQGHAQVLCALFDHAIRAARRLNAETIARDVPSSPDVEQTCRLISQHLRRRSGRDWSVTRRRGKSGRIQIHVLPGERDAGGCMDRFDEAGLVRLLGLPNSSYEQGITVGGSITDRRAYIARAMGLTPTEHGTPNGD